MALRVAFDGSAFENGGQIGIWRYSYEVLARLAGRADVVLWVGNKALQPVPPGIGVFRDSSRVPAHRWQVLKRARRSAHRRFPGRTIAEADVYHASYFAPRPSAAAAHIVTVYDMIAERMFSICDRWAEHDIVRKRAAIESADHLVCISRATADDLLTFYPEAVDRLSVVHLGTEHLTRRSTSPSTTTSDPFALFVGHRDQYKNFWLLAQALQSPRWPSEMTVHVAGSAALPHEVSLLRALGVADKVTFLGRLSDEELRRHYQAATCFVFPSLLEGFGLPILEAQANGCPVVCSDIPVFHEVAGDAAAFFSTQDSDALADAVATTCAPDVRHQMIQAGSQNVARFSWNRTAELTLQIYQRFAPVRP